MDLSKCAYELGRALNAKAPAYAPTRRGFGGQAEGAEEFPTDKIGAKRRVSPRNAACGSPDLIGATAWLKIAVACTCKFVLRSKGNHLTPQSI